MPPHISPGPYEVRDSTILGCQCGAELSRYLTCERGISPVATYVKPTRLDGDLSANFRRVAHDTNRFGADKTMVQIDELLSAERCSRNSRSEGTNHLRVPRTRGLLR